MVEFEEEEKTEVKPWVKELGNKRYAVNTPDGVFELEEIPYEDIDNARKRADASKESLELFVLAKMIKSKDGKEERVGELDIKKMNAKSVMRLLWVLNNTVGMSDFL